MGGWATWGTPLVATSRFEVNDQDDYVIFNSSDLYVDKDGGFIYVGSAGGYIRLNDCDVKLYSGAKFQLSGGGLLEMYGGSLYKDVGGTIDLIDGERGREYRRSFKIFWYGYFSFQ